MIYTDVYVTTFCEICLDDMSEKELRVVLRELVDASRPAHDFRRKFYRADVVLDRAMEKIGERRWRALGVEV